MRVVPKTEEELKQEGSGPRELLRDGIYDFTVSTAEEGTSKNGNDMITAKLDVFDSAGVSHWVYDYLTDGAMAYKLRHLAECVGLLGDYEAGELRAIDLEGRSGQVRIGREGAKGDFGAKNRVVDYVPARKAAQSERQVSRPARQAAQPARRDSPQTRQASRDLDDDIPF
jgi:hypothetical protein